ncbi:MAG: DNA-binding transcriptional MerR regulator [Gammaproteobacteria bacterium]|jgi:DNA-binding transcriptional MerR regulator
MLTVNELAIRANAPAHVVRYYTRIGLIHPVTQQDNGYRLYSTGEASRLRFIRMAKQLGFTLAEIREITKHADHGESPCDDVRRIIHHRIDENRVKIDQLLALQARMEQALTQWTEMPDGVPNGNSICHLIESFDSNPI